MDRFVPSLGFEVAFDAPTSTFDRLLVRYAEPQRHYHTWAHVQACFAARDRLGARHSPAVDLALLFHDAVYDPLARDNEAKSAELLLEEGRRAWLDEPTLQRAAELIVATQRHEAGVDAEAQVVLDADLSILGQPREVFDAYERDVRAEFSMFEDAAYASGRRAVLERFLARPSLYFTVRGRALWEVTARDNLTRSLAQLGP